MADPETIHLCQSIRQEFAREELTREQARLYSQHIRLEMGQEGLRTFSDAEAHARLDEAILLVDAGWLEKTDGVDEDWKQAFRRAGEILEWLSQTSLRFEGAPVHLLSAAAFQVAGYPALALGQLRRIPSDESVSKLLSSFISADFPEALNAVRVYWKKWFEFERKIGDGDRIDGLEELAQLDGFGELAQQHVIRCLGTICAHMRNGDDELTERALEKLDKLAVGYLYSRDSYSYLLARLTSGVARKFVQTSFWPHVDTLSAGRDANVRNALDQFARVSAKNQSALVWPAQVDGIKQLAVGGSFVLCTPTGSGKTTIALLAAAQDLFDKQMGSSASEGLILYLVPSRALAAEVEARFKSDLSALSLQQVAITGLYGGIDWGPTDTWINAEEPAVVVCTFEKADALLRYLGSSFLDRIRTVIIDEAHMVNYNPRRGENLEIGTSRTLRLENLSARLLRARDEKRFRIIALSAVAAGAAPAMASCFGEDENARPVVSDHRSTRQMVGRLEVSASGLFDIRYDLMNGHSLAFGGERSENRPYVPKPFPPLPGGIDRNAGPDVRMRAPTLWAALHLAAKREDGTRPTVLISITEHIIPFAETCANLMDEWGSERLPDYWSTDEDDPSLQHCLSAAEDYFTTSSVEYRLLKYGIAVHHGRMPALLARRLKVAIDRRKIRVIIATSTLSEGVNIPVNTILIPSLYRAGEALTAAEFKNLIGRAGRPGVTTEGSTFAILPQQRNEWNRQRNGYEELVRDLQNITQTSEEDDTTLDQNDTNSALATLISALHTEWQKISGSERDEDFIEWLEAVQIETADFENDGAMQYLDSLDAILLAALQEVEMLADRELDPAEMETEMMRVWRHTYAHAARKEESQLAQFWLARGRAIKSIYSDPSWRRKIYRTSLGPHSGQILLENADEIRDELLSGANYASLEIELRFDFIKRVYELLSVIPDFAIDRKLRGTRKPLEDWSKILRWWLVPATLSKKPTAKELSKWYEFVDRNFIYRGNWGLGSLLGLLLDANDDGKPIDALKIDDWPQSGLPWIAFWLKELVNWGTLDPVVAFLLARGGAVDRRQAEVEAKDYYATTSRDEDPNDILDPRRIKSWFEDQQPGFAIGGHPTVPIYFDTNLVRPQEDYLIRKMSVLPFREGGRLAWIDAAGYKVAYGACPPDWAEEIATSNTFTLSVDKCQIARDLPNFRN